MMSEQRIPPETLKMAAVVIATVPILLVYPFLQKHFAKGAMVGSVKE
jgi:putative aldouronate transport system permease protein